MTDTDNWTQVTPSKWAIAKREKQKHHHHHNHQETPVETPVVKKQTKVTPELTNFINSFDALSIDE